ncbi:MAG: fatty acid desaturase [Alphaproteobacteria bacterium]|nr:fatty acid desaturase [Alphaproteobacteria bacterium]
MTAHPAESAATPPAPSRGLVALEIALRWGSVISLPALAIGFLTLPWPLAERSFVFAAVFVLSALHDAIGMRARPLPLPALDRAARAADAAVWGAVPLMGVAVAAGAWMAPALGSVELAAAMLIFGVASGTTAISASHELIHRRTRWERMAGTALAILACYPHFPVVHLLVHHPLVGTDRDPGTAKRNETLPAFLLRAAPLSWHGAWQAERRQLARRGLGAWSLRNRVLRNTAALVALIAAAGLAWGPSASLFIVGQGAAGMLLALIVDYTQHYGLVRAEIAPGRLEPVQAAHAWTSNHYSNRLTFNLGLHAAHHLEPARPGIALDDPPGSPRTPLGYPGLVLLALVPPLWFRVMNRRGTAAR